MNPENTWDALLDRLRFGPRMNLGSLENDIDSVLQQIMFHGTNSQTNQNLYDLHLLRVATFEAFFPGQREKFVLTTYSAPLKEMGLWVPGEAKMPQDLGEAELRRLEQLRQMYAAHYSDAPEPDVKTLSLVTGQPLASARRSYTAVEGVFGDDNGKGLLSRGRLPLLAAEIRQKRDASQHPELGAGTRETAGAASAG